MATEHATKKGLPATLYAAALDSAPPSKHDTPESTGPRVSLFSDFQDAEFRVRF